MRIIHARLIDGNGGDPQRRAIEVAHRHGILVAVDGDPLEDPRLLVDPANVTLVVKGGRVVKNLP